MAPIICSNASLLYASFKCSPKIRLTLTFLSFLKSIFMMNLVQTAVMEKSKSKIHFHFSNFIARRAILRDWSIYHFNINIHIIRNSIFFQGADLVTLSYCTASAHQVSRDVVRLEPQLLADAGCETPTINYRGFNGRKYRCSLLYSEPFLSLFPLLVTFMSRNLFSILSSFSSFIFMFTLLQ